MWLVARLSPNPPKSVYRHLVAELVEEGHGVYVPTHRVEVVFRSRTALRERPLIPGYIFLRYTHRWPHVSTIDGVSVLTFENDKGNRQPHVVTEDDLRKIEQWTPKEKGTTGFSHGDLVRVKTGVATGMWGRVERKKKGGYEIAVPVLVDGIRDERVLLLAEHALELAVPVRGHGKTLGSSAAGEAA